MSQSKKSILPLIIIISFFIFLFLVPLPIEYNAMKFVMGILVVTYILSLISVYVRKRFSSSDEKDLTEADMEELEKALENMKDY